MRPRQGVGGHTRRLGRVAAHVRRDNVSDTGTNQVETDGEADIVPFAGTAGMGAEVVNLNLRECFAAGWAQGHEGVDVLRGAITAHGLLLFRGQLPRLGADELVHFTRWWGCGRLHSAHKNHPAAEHPDVFRVSNDPAVGCWEEHGIGSGGFHNDGAFMPAPYEHAVYQIVEAPDTGGDTTYANINKCLGDYISRGTGGAADIAFLSGLHTVNDVISSLAFPVVHFHPQTSRALVLLNSVRRVLRWEQQEDGTEKLQELGKEEKARMRKIIQGVMEASTEAHYCHRWRPGDIIVTDNLAVAHKASTQRQATGHRQVDEAVPLRILHRTTVLGTNMLGKVLD